MSTGSSRKVTFDDIERVKSLIEHCILKYMKKKQVMDLLYKQHNIEPCFTNIVWLCLKKQNKKFFNNYYLRLAVLDQLNKYEYLVEKEVAMINQLYRPNEVAAVPPVSNYGSYMQPVPADLQASGLNNCGQFGLQHASEYPFTALSAQNPNIGMNNGTPINDEYGVSSSGCYVNLNPPQLQRTFTDELSAFLSSHPDPDSLFDSNGREPS